MADARPVTVTLVHDQTHSSTLYVPLGQPSGVHLSVERDLHIFYEVLKVEE